MIFYSFGCQDIQYPSEEAVLIYAEDVASKEALSRGKSQDCTKSVKQVISLYMRNDKIYEMHDQDRNEIWSKRQVNHSNTDKLFYFLFYLLSLIIIIQLLF